MNVNYSDLESRLVLNCTEVQEALNKNLNFEEFKAELEKSFTRLKEMFIKKYNLQNDISSLKRVESVIELYKMECMHNFMR